MEKERLVINILGKGEGWDEIPDKPEGLVYGCNDAVLRTPCDTTFHMHDLEVFANQPGTASSTRLFVDYANKHPEHEIYTVKPFALIPHAKEYPLQEIVEYFHVCYFTSTIEFMIAYAIWKQPTVLNFYGVNMTVKLEYMEQKPGVEFWLGQAMGRGIECNLQWDVSSLLKSRDSKLYGYLINQWRVK
jgi:hypothetical protein